MIHVTRQLIPEILADHSRTSMLSYFFNALQHACINAIGWLNFLAAELKAFDDLCDFSDSSLFFFRALQP